MSKRSRRKKEKISSMKQTQPSHIEGDSKKTAPEQEHTHNYEGKKYSKIVRFYDRHYLWLLIIPVLLLAAALVQIGIQTAQTGDFIQKGISLKGGVTITIATDKIIDTAGLKSELLSQFPKLDASVRTLTSAGQSVGYVIEADLQNSADIDKGISIVETYTGIDKKEFGIETIQPSLGASFFEEVAIAMLVAFAFMAIVVFLTFRTFVPSFAAVFSVFSDMVITLAVVNLLGIKVSSAGIAAFLMLIGYSIDTDILLSTRVLKREEGSVLDRILSSVKTGLTMAGTTIVAAIIAFIFTESETLKQIMLIILIGLFVDIFNTWLQNAAILRWYVEHRGKKHGKA